MIQSRTRELVSVIGIGVLISVPLLSVGCNRLTASRASTNPNRASEPDSANPALLVPSSYKIDLGVVPQSGRREYAFLLQNPSELPVTLDKIETSCECLQVSLPRRFIPAKTKAVVVLRFDLGHDKEHQGKLAIEVKGYEVNRKLALALTVYVDTLPEQEFAQDTSDSN
jgi:hypothetical protein